MAWLFLIILTFFVFSYVFLRGEDLSHLDTEVIPCPAGEPSEEHHAVVVSLAEMSVPAHSMTRSDGIASIREKIDAVSDGRVFSSEFRAVDEQGIKGEWVIAPGVNPRRRLLYIHGGAWLAGSPKSHRSITDRLSKLADAAVFSLDYRLLPENSRREGIEDCRQAYRWILANGPDGEQTMDFFAVAGDSAGGNLTLCLIAWARDQQLRAADAVIAFSPATDMTLTSPSLAANVDSDPMLGPAFGKLLRLPKVLLWWMSWYTNRIRPSDIVASPLRGDLSGLPPVLVLSQRLKCCMTTPGATLKRPRRPAPRWSYNPGRTWFMYGKFSPRSSPRQHTPTTTLPSFWPV